MRGGGDVMNTDPGDSGPQDLPSDPTTGLPVPAGSGLEFVPYASGMRDSRKGLHPPAEFYRQGETLITRDGVTLPCLCILCGQEGQEPPIRLVFTWDTSFRRTRSATLELRSKVEIRAFLCAVHRRRWQRARRLGSVGIAVCMLAMLLGLAVAVASESSDYPIHTPAGMGLAIGGFAGMIVALFYFTLKSRTVTCNRIQGGYIYLDGAAPGFLARLPALPGEAQSAANPTAR